MHEFADGSTCQAAARNQSTRCRHHQLDFRTRQRACATKKATLRRKNKVVGQQARQILTEPFEQGTKHLRKLRALGFLSRSREKQLRFALQIYKSTQRQLAEMRDNKGFGSGRRSI